MLNSLEDPGAKERPESPRKRRLTEAPGYCRVEYPWLGPSSREEAGKAARDKSIRRRRKLPAHTTMRRAEGTRKTSTLRISPLVTSLAEVL